MRWNEIAEDAAADVAANKQAKELVELLVAHFLDESKAARNWYLEGVRFSGNDAVYAMLTGTRLGFPEDLKDLGILFAKQKGYVPSGALGSFKSGIKYVRVDCVDDPTDAQQIADKVVYNHRVHDVLEHEFIHFLDSFRIPNILSPELQPEKGDDSACYNNGVEFNAYYHNIASSLMTAVQQVERGMDKETARKMMSLKGITSDFRETVANILRQKQGNMVLADFLKHLNDRNHKALLKRLYGLHSKLMGMVSETVVEDAVAPPSTEEVRAWAQGVESRLGLAQFDVWPNSQGDLKLNLLVVPKDRRKDGLGSKAVSELCDYADRYGLRVTLSPALKDDRMGTTSRTRLVTFYKRFGFVENKGRNKDFSISDGMYRPARRK